jgi:hypothetical protein
LIDLLNQAEAYCRIALHATAIADPVLRRDATVSDSSNFKEVDRASEDVLNIVPWRAMRNSRQPDPAFAKSS